MINIMHKKLHIILSRTSMLLWLALVFNLSAQPNAHFFAAGDRSLKCNEYY